MAKIEGISIQNYRVLKDVSMGRGITRNQDKPPLSGMTVMIGRNGSGKSALLDAFGFLSDCLKFDVEKACDKRGGYERLCAQGNKKGMTFEIYYRQVRDESPISYVLTIAADKNGRPYVESERLRQRTGKQYGYPLSFLHLKKGRGWAWRGKTGGIEEDDKQAMRETSAQKEEVDLGDTQKLGIVGIVSVKMHPRIAAFRQFIENWYLSYFSPNAARVDSSATLQRHLDSTGSNIGNVVRYLQKKHSKHFKSILMRISEHIPDIERIEAKKTEDNHVILRFFYKGFEKPFYPHQISDGTLKLFAYLLLLEDPDPPPFICIEEPENGIYQDLLRSVAHAFDKHAGETQMFVTTHSPIFLKYLNPDDVWRLEKGNDGFSRAKNIGRESYIQSFLKEEETLQELWERGHFEPAKTA